MMMSMVGVCPVRSQRYGIRSNALGVTLIVLKSPDMHICYHDKSIGQKYRVFVAEAVRAGG